MRLTLASFLLTILTALPGAQPLQRAVFFGQNQPEPYVASHSMTLVNNNECGSNGANYVDVIICTITATTAGNSLLIGFDGAAPSSFSPTATAIASTSSGAEAAVGNAYIIPNVTAGTTTVTVNLPSYQYYAPTILIAEVHGVVTSSPIDAISSGAMSDAGSYGTSGSLGSVTATNANDVVCGMVWTTNHAQTYSATGSFSLFAQTTYSGSNPSLPGDQDLAFICANESSTGSYNPSASWASTGYWASGSFALKLQ